MLEKFISYYSNNDLFANTDKVLLAVSGGKDSVAMLNLFIENNLSFGVAHCNFQLRGEDADLDENFVREFSEKNKITFHTTTFSTQEYASEKGISIQMAARELRYEWFEKIRNEYNYKYIAIAHHKNDVAETMLINLTKGTGLAGLHGIRNKNEKIIRPILCFDKVEIDNYFKVNDLSYREDNSNSNTKYIRNSIRHQVIPKLEKINPSLIETLNNSAKLFLNDEKIILDKVLEEKNRLFRSVGRGFQIKISDLKKLSPLKSYLYYFLREYGFNITTITDIILSFNNQSGKQFYSPTHQITKDRDFLILLKIEDCVFDEKVINSFEELSQIDDWRIKMFQNDTKFKIRKDSKSANLDLDKIKFPLIIRNWKYGDSFQPLGMKGIKKLSDFFIDNKLSVPTKYEIKILTHQNKIVWVVGHRIDDNYKITEHTKNILVIYSQPIM
jgi:tRNA(Ile)-lysidine synthase